MTHRLPLFLLMAFLGGCSAEKDSAPQGVAADPAPVAPEPQAAVPRDGEIHWRPVRIGAGGFVTGFATHPLNANVRYCRTDVGNAYRWDGREWQPMLVAGGLPDAVTAVPGVTGVDSVAVDPTNESVVYLAFKVARSNDLAGVHPRLPGNVYRSVDGGRSFVGGDLAVEMKPNGDWRAEGERIGVDPLDPAVVYYGSIEQGLWRSRDAGETWTAVAGAGAPAATQNVINLWFDAASGPASGARHCRVLYAVEAQGAVRMSEDGGESWRDISSGIELSGKCKTSTIDAKGTLYVVQGGSRTLWRWRGQAWAAMNVSLPQSLKGVAVDPRDTARIWVIANDSSTGRSFDDGASWVSFGMMDYANTLGWLPQKPGWRSNGGIYLDRDGKLWVPQGNEGMVSWVPGPESPKWTIDSVGIEEFVTHDVIMPPGGSAVVAVHDATGLVIDDPDTFSARQIPLQDQLISNGTSVAYCPNDPAYIVIPSADVNWTSSGKNFSGYSRDGGKSWQAFPGLPCDEAGKPLSQAGRIVVGRRGDWAAGSDHLVWLPTGKFPPYYSHDGGKSWHPSIGFPPEDGYWNFSLKRRTLQADPFQPDRFYVAGTWRGGFYISTDGGKSWEKQEQAGLPHFLHHAQLAVNPKLEGDLWFVTGWEGTSRQGMWHSRDGGRTFQQVAGVEHAVTVAIGAGRGFAGDADYTLYFIGKRSGAPAWGVFRSTDAGASWTRISGHPGGIFDQPTCMAASWDTFSDIMVGFVGNSFVRGTLLP